ncbi:MAG: hypothetical protein MUF43_08305 [Flavobacterium sp.]|jgi:hypothetical protein|nr:hypothetical protein [Flavobacterium sp.]
MKNSKLKLLYILFFIVLYSCSTPKFYNEVNEMQTSIKYETEKNTDNAIRVKIKSNDVNRLVFKRLEKELVNTNHIIYFNIPSSSITDKKYWFVVYDVDNQIYYELESDDNKKKRIQLLNTSDTLTDSFYRFVFDSYLDDKCDMLKEKGKSFMSGVRTYEAIYEVNLESKVNRNCYFRDFYF